MFRDSTKQTSLINAAFALFVGAFVSLGISLILASIAAIVGNSFHEPLQQVLSVVVDGIGYFPFFLAAMAVIGAPTLFCCHLIKLRTWLSAVTVGFAIPFIAFICVYVFSVFESYGFTSSSSDPYASLSAWLFVLMMAFFFGGIGAVTGPTIWYFTYRWRRDV